MLGGDASKVFERVADSYDQVLPFFAEIGTTVVAAIAPRPGMRVLDVGAGRGALVGPAVARGCHVTAIDASPTMIAHLSCEHPTATALVMRAEQLAFRDETFDLVTAAFVLNLLREPAAGAAEARRVLRSGGRIAMPAVAPPQRTDAASIQNALDALFDEFSAYLPPDGGMGSPLNPRQLLLDAGFVEIETIHTEVAIPVPDGDTLWRWAMSHGYRAFIDDLPIAQREAMRTRMVDIPRRGAVLQRGHTVLLARKS